MGERPILFSGPMVRAILAGAKTQTRRVVKPAPGKQAAWLTPALLNDSPRAAMVDGGAQFAHPRGGPLTWVRCPYGAPGDTLWVRETWQTETDPSDRDPAMVRYAADGPVITEGDRWTWRPSIHMPRWASRITLRVTSVRVERLHAITEDDARAEGIASLSVQTGPHAILGRPFATEFAALWRTINGPESWGAYPWVWVVGFERAEEVSRG